MTGLKYTLIVVHPETSVPTALLAGSEVPDWAVDLVHSDDIDSPAAPAGNASTDEQTDTDPPAGNASTEVWQAYARSKGATDADLEGKSRDELREQYGA